MDENNESKSIFVTLAGRANAGKSSLLNALVGEKIAMVTKRPQTTRTAIRGIVTKNNIQYVFIDTPGVQKAKNRLGEHMNKAIRNSIADIDAVVYVADVMQQLNELDDSMLKDFKRSGIPVILFINKTDLLKDKSDAALKTAEYARHLDFYNVIQGSVIKEDGPDRLMSALTHLAAPSPHYFPEDYVTDQPEKVLMSEIIREKLMTLMYDEIPHGIAVTIEELNESVTKSGEDILNISANIFCEKESHKGMIIGKNGEMLKKAGQTAREELEDFFRIRVNLQLWVKVKDDWRNREGLIKNFGLSSSDK